MKTISSVAIVLMFVAYARGGTVVDDKEGKDHNDEGRRPRYFWPVVETQQALKGTPLNFL